MTNDLKVDKKKQSCYERIKLFEVAYVCRWSKIFFIEAYIKEDSFLKFLALGFILDHIFGHKKDKPFCPVFVFVRGMSNAICHLVLYLQSLKNFMNISGCNSIGVLIKNGFCNTIFYSVTNRKPVYFSKKRWIWDLGGKFRQKRIHLLWAFWNFIFKFFIKRGNHEEQSQSKWDWSSGLYNSLHYLPLLGTCFGDTGILV